MSKHSDMQYCPECGINSTAGARVLRGEKGTTKSLRIELDAALEREQALAAHIERMKDLLDGTIESNLDAAPEYDREVSQWLSDTPTNSLSKRDLIKQAEALELATAKVMRVQDSQVLYSIATRYRQQAAALTNEATQ